MLRSDGPAKPRTVASLPPSRIAGKTVASSTAASISPSTPPGAASCRPRIAASPRSTTVCAPKPFTSAASADPATAITRSPSATPSSTAYPPTAPAAPVTPRVCPGLSASRSSARRTVSPFIGRVAAASRLVPSGTRATDAVGTTTCSAWAPPPGRRGLTIAITRSPWRNVAPSPTASTTPASSIPGMKGGRTPIPASWSTVNCRPLRKLISVGLTVAAATRIRTSLAPTVGSGNSDTSSTSGPPSREKVTARMSVPSAELAVIPTHDLFGDDLEHDALGRAGRGPRIDRRRIRLRDPASLERRPHRRLALEDLAAAANHDPPQLGIIVASLHHQRHLGVAPDVDDLLGLAVRGHVEGAVAGEVVHGDDVREAVPIDRREGRLLALPEECGLLVGGELDLLAPIDGHL